MSTETTELARQVIAWAAGENIPVLDGWGTGEDERPSVLLNLDRRQTQVTIVDWNVEARYCVRLFNEHGRCVSDTMTTDYKPIVREFLKGNRRTIELYRLDSSLITADDAHQLKESLNVLPRNARWVITATEVPEVES